MKLATSLLLLHSLFAVTLAAVFEAEDGILTNTTVRDSFVNFTGHGYVDGFHYPNSQVTFIVPSEDRQLSDVKIRYMAPYGSKKLLLVHRGLSSEISLVEGSEFTTVSAGQLLLEPGNNEISILSNWGWYLIDAIEITPSKPRPPHNITATLVNSNSSAAAKALYAFLRKNYGKHYISGQQDPLYIKWVEEKVGKTPAILGVDMMDYSPSRVEFGLSSTEVEEAIKFDARGGIVSFCWHWNAPAGLYNVEGKEWWRGFYTTATDFDISTAIEPTNANYTLLVRDIDAIAVQLKRLQDADVPVLWRPLHEAEGGWFWWGAKGPEPCKKLWNLVYDRLNNYHKLNNLIWVWNSVSPEWYPGDETIDLLSLDSYPPKGDHNPVSAGYNALLSLGQGLKMAATAEVGSIPDPELLELYEAHWSYFITWGGEFITDGISNDVEYLKRIYSSEIVLTLDEITGWKVNITAPNPTSQNYTIVKATNLVQTITPNGITPTLIFPTRVSVTLTSKPDVKTRPRTLSIASPTSKLANHTRRTSKQATPVVSTPPKAVTTIKASPTLSTRVINTPLKPTTIVVKSSTKIHITSLVTPKKPAPTTFVPQTSSKITGTVKFTKFLTVVPKPTLLTRKPATRTVISVKPSPRTVFFTTNKSPNQTTVFSKSRLNTTIKPSPSARESINPPSLVVVTRVLSQTASKKSLTTVLPKTTVPVRPVHTSTIMNNSTATSHVSPATALPCLPKYSKCGGAGMSENRCCIASTCKFQSSVYSQCL